MIVRLPRRERERETMMMGAHVLLRPLILSSRSGLRHVSFFQTAAGDMALRLRTRAAQPRAGAEEEEKKSKNEKKREARRAVKWGIDLASFSTPQIRRVLTVASAEPEVFEAIMLVKRLGRDVREGKRRQFNYIGRLLREAEPELMDGLIQATKDGDESKFQSLSNTSETLISEHEDDNESEDIYSSDEDEDSHDTIEKASRWFNGLVNKDVDISKEIYSLQDVDFDRQELRRLVRKLQSTRERQTDLEENQEGVEKAITGAERSLSRFLQNLAKQLPPE